MMVLDFLRPKFVEGNQEEYRWFVPHDLSGLLSLFKSSEYYVEQLSNFFEFAKRDKCVVCVQV